jgi:GNAT superfamily N-acetyltransferase
MDLQVLPITTKDYAWVEWFIHTHWGSCVVVHGAVFYPASLAGFIAWQDQEPVGLVTYLISGDQCEIITIDSLQPGHGIGTALLAAVHQEAQGTGCRRVWLVTTNDNVDALRFYQRCGFTISALRCNAVAAARLLKPEIPLTGAYGIPIRDEIELEVLYKGSGNQATS